MSAKLTCRKCESNSTNLIQVLLWGNRTTYRAAETCDVYVQQSSRRGREERGWKEEQPTALPAEGSTRKTEKEEKTTRDISRISLDLEERIGSTRDQMNPELSPERKGSGPTKGPRNELRIEQQYTLQVQKFLAFAVQPSRCFDAELRDPILELSKILAAGTFFRLTSRALHTFVRPSCGFSH